MASSARKRLAKGRENSFFGSEGYEGGKRPHLWLLKGHWEGFFDRAEGKLVVVKESPGSVENVEVAVRVRSRGGVLRFLERDVACFHPTLDLSYNTIKSGCDKWLGVPSPGACGKVILRGSKGDRDEEDQGVRASA